MPDSGIVPEDIDNSPSELPVPLLESIAVGQIDYRAKFAEVSEELVQEREKISFYKKRLNELESVRHTNAVLDDLIKPMANKIFCFMCVYCLAVLGVLLLDLYGNLKVPDQVLIFLVGSTAVTVVGLVGTIVTGIFSGARRHH